MTWEMTWAEYLKRKREGTLPQPKTEKPKRKRTKKSDED